MNKGISFIYLDNAATTKPFPEVVKLMSNIQSKMFGNPASIHAAGEEAFNVLASARKTLASGLGCKSKEIVFTSGTTESINLALLGFARANKSSSRKKIIISEIEHIAVKNAALKLKDEGFKLVIIPVDELGHVKFDVLKKEVDKKTLWVSIQHANNEFGTVQRLSRMGSLCRAAGAAFHVDAAQSFGKLPLDVHSLKIDLLSAGAHKLNGPKGSGLLFIRSGLVLSPIIFGGSHEMEVRSGTQNVAGAAGFARSYHLQKRVNQKKITALRDYFMIELEKLGGKITGDPVRRLPNNVHVTFVGESGEEVLLKLSNRGIMCSTGSACSNLCSQESMLYGVGLSDARITGALRFSLGYDTSKKELEYTLKVLKGILKS